MKDLQREVEKTRKGVAQITCWCIVIALHQKFGVGRERLERLAGEIDGLQETWVEEIARSGHVQAMRMLQSQVMGPAEFRVPVLRAPRTRREESLRTAGNEAATASWCVFALAIRKVLGFGENRMKQLHEETVANYRQVNEWGREDMEWAMQRLAHCAGMAMRETVTVLHDEEEQTDPLKEAAEYAAWMEKRFRNRNLSAARRDVPEKKLFPADGNAGKMREADRILQEMTGKCSC